MEELIKTMITELDKTLTNLFKPYEDEKLNPTPIYIPTFQLFNSEEE